MALLRLIYDDGADSAEYSISEDSLPQMADELRDTLRGLSRHVVTPSRRS